jgi:hypothetical protein
VIKNCPYLGPAHPLADVAAQHCDHAVPRLGSVACGACWELAIRDDERVAVLYDLPRELAPDPTHVDEVAVELACRGERVDLTPVERAEAARRLAGKGLSTWQIAKRLHTRRITRGPLTGAPAA